MLSTLDIQNGNLIYSESYGGTTNVLSIVSTGTSGDYTIIDQNQTITLSSAAMSLGWTGDGTNTVTGPTSTVTNLAIDATNQDSDLIVGSIDAPATVNGFKSVLVGGAVGGGFPSLEGIRQPLDVINTGGTTLLTLDDSGTTSSQQWTVQPNTVAGPSPSPITFAPAQMARVILNGGDGGNLFTVVNTVAPTTINSGTGGDSVVVQGAGADLTINGQGGGLGPDDVTVVTGPTVAGSLNIVGPAGSMTLAIQDTNAGVNRSGTLSAGRIAGYTAQAVLFDVPALTSLHIIGGIGDDLLTVDFGAGNPIPSPGGLDYDGGIGDNSLALTGGSFVNEHIQSTGPNSGTIDLDGSRIRFGGLTPIFDTVPVVNFRLDAPNGSNTINVINGPNVGGFATTEVNSGNTPSRFELVDFANKTNVVLTALNDSPIGNEVFVMNNPVPAAGLATMSILTGDTDDTILLQGPPAGVAVSVDTGGGNDVVSFFGGGLSANGSYAANGGLGTNTMNVDANGALVTFSQTSVNLLGRPPITLANFAQVNIANAGDPPLAPIPVTFQGTVGVPLTDEFVGAFTDGDPRGQVGRFTAAIDWGDGTAPTAGTITQPGGVGTEFRVLGSHTYNTSGTFPVLVTVVGARDTRTTVLGPTTFTVTDVGGATTQIHSTANVPSPVITFTPIPVTATEDVAFTSPLVTIATMSVRPGTFTATIDWGDGTAPTAGTIVPQPNGTLVVSGSHAYLRESEPGAPYVVTVRITDPLEVTTSVTTTATVLSNNIVTNVADSGPGSLRAVILDVNADRIHTAIRFKIPGAGPHRIAPASALPVIRFPVVIDGRSQPGFRGAPVVEIHGRLAGPSADGLTLAGGESTVQGLVVNGFGGSGIILEGRGGNRIVGNRIGTDVNGTRSVGNGNGIDLFDVAGNVVGGTTAAERNIISGNRIVGIRLSCNGATGNRVQGNFIGTDAAGRSAVPNFQGVLLLGSPRNLIGGTAPGAGNVISGNTSAGVQVFNDATVFNGRPICDPPGVASGNVLQGNRIGTNAAGNARLGNAQGIFVNDASSTLIGGSTPGAANIISGNRSIGVQILGNNATSNAVLGNFIGTNRAQARGLGNSVGVYVYARSGNVVGLGSSPGANTIAFNRTGGVRIRPLSQGPSVERVDLLPATGGPITRIVVTFTTYMNRQRVLNAANYVITPIGRNSQPGRRIPVVPAAYNEINRTVTLVLGRSLPRGSTFDFRVVGTSPNGLTDRAGNFLDGNPAVPRQRTGSDFEETFRRGVQV